VAWPDRGMSHEVAQLAFFKLREDSSRHRTQGTVHPRQSELDPHF
jgi:hypothetical protein